MLSMEQGWGAQPIKSWHMEQTLKRRPEYFKLIVDNDYSGSWATVTRR